MPRRNYGKTGIKLSIIGLGGIVVTKTEQNQANRVVAEAYERGVNYFDVAPAYGNAEQILGPALKPYRKNVFLACKTGQRKREGAEMELKRSLKRLKTDYFDLYQLHAIIDVKKDVDTAFAKGGAMEVFIEARKSGMIRHLGFSVHTIEAAFAAMDRYDFDSVLFPVNFACFAEGNFGPQIMAKAKSKGLARLALKAMARQEWPKNDPERKRYKKCWYQPVTDPHEAELALRFTLSQPVTAAIPPGDESLFRLALDIARKFKPITTREEKELIKLAKTLNPIFQEV
ncbi:MAG: aldo/keto reductase [Planctomycetota bacterium]|nr:MAG: aldo/keto reductase [Planctomycetota bacterium]